MNADRNNKMGIATKNLTTKDTKDHEGSRKSSRGFTQMNADRNNKMGIATKNLTTKDTKDHEGSRKFSR
jgi:hypothetical protein